MKDRKTRDKDKDFVVFTPDPFFDYLYLGKYKEFYKTLSEDDHEKVQMVIRIPKYLRKLIKHYKYEIEDTEQAIVVKGIVQLLFNHIYSQEKINEFKEIADKAIKEITEKTSRIADNVEIIEDKADSLIEVGRNLEREEMSERISRCMVWVISQVYKYETVTRDYLWSFCSQIIIALSKLEFQTSLIDAINGNWIAIDPNDSNRFVPVDSPFPTT